jgi:hypothetical protein
LAGVVGGKGFLNKKIPAVRRVVEGLKLENFVSILSVKFFQVVFLQ